MVGQLSCSCALRASSDMIIDHVPLHTSEWWGITEEIKDQAAYLAQKGDYRVLVPDLYKGKIGVDAEEASHVRLFWLACAARCPSAFSMC